MKHQFCKEQEEKISSAANLIYSGASPVICTDGRELIPPILGRINEYLTEADDRRSMQVINFSKPNAEAALSVSYQRTKLRGVRFKSDFKKRFPGLINVLIEPQLFENEDDVMTKINVLAKKTPTLLMSSAPLVDYPKTLAVAGAHLDNNIEINK